MEIYLATGIKKYHDDAIALEPIQSLQPGDKEPYLLIRLTGYSVAFFTIWMVALSDSSYALIECFS